VHTPHQEYQAMLSEFSKKEQGQTELSILENANRRYYFRTINYNLHELQYPPKLAINFALQYSTERVS
jgi:hypothetical protein